MSIVSALAPGRNVVYTVAAFWVGAAWMMGFVVAPVLFSFIVDRALAGNIAGFLFRIVNVSGFVIFAGVLLGDREHLIGRAKSAVVSVLVGCFLQAAVLAPLVLIARTEHASWFGLAHGVSTVAYLAVLVAASYWLARLVAASGASK